jgi:hypothetical protein
MTDSMSDKSALRPTTEYNIYGQAGCFTINFSSSYNTMHQISGFKTEDVAQAWVAEARLLVGTYT